VRQPPATNGSRWFLAALIFVAAYWLFDLAILHAGAPDPLDDSWEYGVVARSLLAGHGFRTGVIHPPLWTLRDANGTVPVLIHGPLIPVLIAPLISAFGNGVLDRLAWLAALFALLAAWATYRLGARAFGPEAGAAAAALFTVSPLMLEAVHHDLSLPLGAALLGFAIERLHAPRPRPLVAGIALGLASLARPEMLIAALVLMPFAGRAWWRLGLAAAACALPWWVHTARAVGTPLFNLSSYLLVGYWGQRPDLTVLRDFDLTPARWPGELLRALPGLPGKWADFFPHAMKRALLVPTGGCGWLAIAGALAMPREARRLGATMLSLAIIPIAIMTATLYDPRYLTPFLPLWAGPVAWGARALAARLPAWARRPRLWISALALIAAPSVGPALHEGAREARGLEVRLARERLALAPLAAGAHEEPRPMFSDTPDFVAWTTSRPVVWITADEWGRLPLVEAGGAQARPARGEPGATSFHARAPAPWGR
jgi:hypothetical protein